ncbi:MAG TPA: 4Fe-4S binding protein [Thermodesulfobacteriota bacterium]|nr:4Fe-4S binding protein [Thermodesulfobacteriota bacterium]
MAETAKKLPRIEISEVRCKGCSICVDFCPTNVLEMKGSIAAVRDLDACTRCQLCDLRCPDFAIRVFD